jgi:hypothetical protein
MKYLLPDRLYTVLKWAALIALPAVGTCYRVLAAIWALPYGGEVLATCTAAALFLGTLLGVSAATATPPTKPGGTDTE